MKRILFFSIALFIAAAQAQVGPGSASHFLAPSNAALGTYATEATLTAAWPASQLGSAGPTAYVLDGTGPVYWDGSAWAQYGTGSGSVTTASVATANGFAGTVATANTTPVITIKTGVTGLLLGNGTGVAAAASSDILGLFPSSLIPAADINYATPGPAAFTTLTATQIVHGVTVLCSYAGAAIPPTGAFVHTGDTSETNLASSCKIPASAMGTVGSLEITSGWYRSAATTNNVKFVIRFGAQAAVTGNLLAANVPDATSGSVAWQQTTNILNLTASTQIAVNPVISGGFGSSAAAPTAGSINTAIDEFVNFNCIDVTSSADSCGLYSYVVKLVVP